MPWLDAKTASLVRQIIIEVARKRPNLRAAVLYGSIARHEERPLADPEPSDVDLLLVFARFRAHPVDFTYAQRVAIFDAVGAALDVYPDAPREVQVMLATEDFADWDETFVRNVLRDGIVLWERGKLRGPLAAMRAAAAT